jgi:hypothetical protein
MAIEHLEFAAHRTKEARLRLEGYICDCCGAKVLPGRRHVCKETDDAKKNPAGQSTPKKVVQLKGEDIEADI